MKLGVSTVEAYHRGLPQSHLWQELTLTVFGLAVLVWLAWMTAKERTM